MLWTCSPRHPPLAGCGPCATSPAQRLDRKEVTKLPEGYDVASYGFESDYSEFEDFEPP
jgi:hypothetical protein